MEVVQCSRSHVDLLLRGDHLSRKFHDLFEYKDAETAKKKLEKKKSKKKKLKTKEKKRKRDKSPELPDTQLPSIISTHGNASVFTLYATVRQSVLAQIIRESTRLYHLANTATDSDSDSDDDAEEKGKELPIKIPKIVGLGLTGVFELIRGSRGQYPELCVEALRALFYLLQGQRPEGMKREPPDIVESLFSLLMDLAINTGDDMVRDRLSMSSLACSALISLTIALSDTEKLLRAITVMLMSRSGLELQDIQVPGILASLQKSVQAVLLGKSQLPDWFNHGVKVKSLAQVFKLANAKVGECPVENSAIASDGRHLYILNKYGLYKVGSGYGGTIKGKLESHKKDFPVHKNTFLAFAVGKLLCKWDRGNTPSLCVINRNTLAPENTFGMDGNSSPHSLLFSDGDNIGYIAPTKEEDSFVIRTFSPVSSPPMSQVNEVPLKLTRKCLDVIGPTAFDFTYDKRTVVTGFDEDSLVMVSGKEFSLIRTVGGKVLYQGKAASLGIKQSSQSQGKWAELTITKSPKIVHIALGHDGLHALMVAEDGSVYFVGTARRGEDGDASAGKNVRRQPKPSKPRKMSRLESKFVTSAACSSGTSSVVTRDGELYMFGKDTNNHCDPTTGLVTELKDVQVTQVSLGKAHAVVLTNKGRVYTFGINNKGQCGREYAAYGVSQRDASLNITMVEDEDENEVDDNLCPPGKHKWVQEVCMICSVCQECTGYGVSCIKSGRKDRNPGMPCGCGAGDSGCSQCGACRVCAEEKLGVHELDERGLLDVIPGRRADAAGKKDKMQLRQAQKLAKEKKQREGASEEAEVTKLVSLPPAEITIDNSGSPVIHITVGLHHSLVLLQNGDVYSFGSNNNGQLGHGDTKIRGRPTKVHLPLPASMIAAGNHHSVMLLTSGQVFTCGDHQKGALGRNGLDESPVKSKNIPWYSVPGPVPGVGAKYGRRATWVGASGDQTTMRIDESLINAHTLTKSNIFASKTCIGLIPRGEDNAGSMRCLMISKTDGNCKSFSGEEQEDLSNQAVCLDPVYDVLWGYNAKSQEIRCYNVMISEAQHLKKIDPGYCDIFSPELAVPTRMGCQATRSHCALHILGCLDTLTIANQLKLQVTEESREKATVSKVYTKEDYSVVNRFESHGGGWGYSGHSVEAIRFMSDTDILLGGLGLFGGRGGYLGRIKLYELGLEGGENEGDGELLAETEETQFVCGAREKYAMLFDEPVPIQANNWYVAWARISGPSSDCGANGLSNVHTDDSVVFKFKSSRKSNNGTDVNAGQIPQLVYKLPPRDSPAVTRKADQVDPAHILSAEFSHTVTPQSLEAVLKLLENSWSALHATVPTSTGFKGEQEEILSELQRIVFISRACLRLLRTYVADIYPDGVLKRKTPPESAQLAERVGDARDLLRRILAEDLHVAKIRATLTEHQGMKRYRQMREEVLNECHATFRACFHAFYPTGHLKWWCLCDLLCQTEPILERRGTAQQSTSNVMGMSRLLAAVMEAMCHPAVKLTAIMPINCEPETEEVLRRHSMNIDDNTNAMARLGEMHRYPLLASHMTCRMEEDIIPAGSHVTFKEVLDRLLIIVSVPVKQLLNKETPSFSSTLVANTCALLTTIIGELAATAMGLEMDINVSSRPMLVTPNRFMRSSNTCQWNTGKGSPDGIAISVDKPGIVMAGICVYGGSGTYEYEVEVLKEEDSNEGQKQSGKPESWTSLELVKGVYTQEDCMNDIAEIKFARPLPLKEGQKYAVLLRNSGQRTVHGDSGIAKVRCSDGTVFTFSTCVQSSNGTNIIRGQIPQILYYSTPQEGEPQTQSSRNLMELLARRNAIDICGAVIHMTTDLLHRAHSHTVNTVADILGSSHLFSSLLPLALAYAGPVAVQDPRGAVQVLNLVQEILPAVSGFTRFLVPAPMTGSTLNMQQDSSSSSGSGSGGDMSSTTTTSQHYAVVESDHPYKAANVVNYKVEFPATVRWMVIEFDPQCATGQPEDSLQLSIPAYLMSKASHNQGPQVITTISSDLDTSTTHWPVLKKFYGTSEWPKSAVILPGNEVIFSLETASDYVKDEKASFFGFKCLIVGYEWGNKSEESILMLERELAYLGGMCCSALMKKDIPLPSASIMDDIDEDLDVIEAGAKAVFENHSSLLEKGFALSHAPTIYQALEGNLPLCWQSNEHSFLQDFVLCTPATSGGRLAKWLQPDSYLDPKNCEIECNRDELKCSWPAVVTVYTKDQYGSLVNVPNLKMEVRAVPIDQLDVGDDLKKMRKTSSRGSETFDMTFGGHLAPVLDTPYEPTLKDKDMFHAITIMKAYENYSFEELRLASPAIPRPSENMLVCSNRDGTYTANWTPGSVGFYNIVIIIDGVQSGDGYKVEVKEPPQGAPPPANVKKSQPPRLRKFIAKYSAGLRVRVSPTLQSEQIGVVPPNCVISFVDETTNDDGMWLRLSRFSLAEYCSPDEGGNARVEGWCMQYNQHLGKTLLVPVETAKPQPSHRSPRAAAGAAAAAAGAADGRRRERRTNSQSDGVGVFLGPLVASKGPGTYKVIKCGAYGHNIRARPNLKAPPIGMITKGKKIKAVEDIINQDGVWIRLSEESAQKYCHASVMSEAWSLVTGMDKVQYMQHESEFSFGGLNQDPFAFRSLPPQSHQGFQFAMKAAQYASAIPGFFPSEEVFTRSKSMPSSAFSFGGVTGFQPKVQLPRFGEPVAEEEDVAETSPSPPPLMSVANYNDIQVDDDDTLEEAVLDRILRARQRSSSSPNPFMSIPPIPTQPAANLQRTLSLRTIADPRGARLTLEDNKDIPPELQGVPVNELVKALGESRANGNGPTPQPSPPGSPKKGSREGSPKYSNDTKLSMSTVRKNSKEELFKTPPSSPVQTRTSRAPLQKVDSIDKSDTPTPPLTPQTERSADKVARTRPAPPPKPTDKFDNHHSMKLASIDKETKRTLSPEPFIPTLDEDDIKTKYLSETTKLITEDKEAKTILPPQLSKLTTYDKDIMTKASLETTKLTLDDKNIKINHLSELTKLTADDKEIMLPPASFHLTPEVLETQIKHSSELVMLGQVDNHQQTKPFLEADKGNQQTRSSIETDKGNQQTKPSLEAGKGYQQTGSSPETDKGNQQTKPSLEASKGYQQTGSSPETDKGNQQTKPSLEASKGYQQTGSSPETDKSSQQTRPSLETDKGNQQKVSFSPDNEKTQVNQPKINWAKPDVETSAPEVSDIISVSSLTSKFELFTSNKKNSQIVVVAPTMKSSSTTSIHAPFAVEVTSVHTVSTAGVISIHIPSTAGVTSIHTLSTAGVTSIHIPSVAGVSTGGSIALAGGLSSGTRTRFRSPPYRDDSPLRPDTSCSLPSLDIVDTGVVGASGSSSSNAGAVWSIGAGAAAASVSAAGGSSSHKSNMFTIGTGSPRDNTLRLSPKSSRKDRSSRSSRTKRERASSPSLMDVTPPQRSRSSSASKILERNQTVKEALSPAAAECLRSVFAAFMWHEGIVHDAMACASFLKFHPDLTKEMSKFVKEKKLQSNAEPKRQRHATESSKDKTHRCRDNINESRVRFNLEPQYSDADRDVTDVLRPRSASSRAALGAASDMPLKPLLCETKSDADAETSEFVYKAYGGGVKRTVERHKSEAGTAKFQEIVEHTAKQNKGEKETQLPKTLQHLVHFWEELSESVIHVMNQETVPPSPAMTARIKQHERREKDKDKERKMKKRKGAKPLPLPIMDGADGGGYRHNIAVRAQGLFGEAVVRMFHPRGGGGAPGGGGGDIGAAAAAAVAVVAGAGEDTFCELCQSKFAHPVTYHMRSSHPGCGKNASGKGYNSSGIFGGGWAGNCGDGGIGECSWYLMCEKCREKFMKEKKSLKDKGRKNRRRSITPSSNKQQNFLSPMEAHHILKNNAQFLLELASATDRSLPKHSKSRPLSLPRSEMYLPSVSEVGTDPEPFPPVAFQYLNLHNAGNSDSAFADDFFLDDDERVFVRSGSMSITSQHRISILSQRPRLPTEPRHSPLARSGSLGQETRPFSQLLPPLKHENTRAMLEKQPMTKSAGTSPENEQDSHKKAFHRSISEYVTENDDNDEFILSRAVSVSSRRRNNSGSVTDGGVSLLKHPSVAMTRLISAVEKRNGGHTLQRPVMEFIVQRHDLEGLQLAMKQALRKAICRVFALQALNWLIRSVVQQVCLHDLLWFFVDSLIPNMDDEMDGLDEEGAEIKKKEVKKDTEDVPICDHPMSDIIVAGKAAAQLPETFHNVLRTISDVMMLLPMGSALQQMAVRCYCLQFMQCDHQFLHESHVFSNLSRILSKSEEEPEDGSLDASMISHKVICLKDLTAMTDIKASSRQAMIASLTDNSTETFWESGDEDRNKLKVVAVTCSVKTLPSIIYIHVDNIRDMANKVSSVTFNAGSSADDLKKVKLVDIDARHCGWINCPLPTSSNAALRHLTIELKGPDQSLRLRQVKILGAVKDEQMEVEVRKGAVQIQQENCESETLKVFRILTSQVFGKLVTSPEDSETEDDKREDKVDGDNDLKEHMVSILFSRSKLSHMQRQVCNHIVQGIRKEAMKMKEEWGHGLVQASDEIHGSDVYCFELVSMVVALSGSSVGRKYLAQQCPLVQDLFSLLHTATPRIQRQIITIFRRVLPWVKPQLLATILSIPSLPPPDYNIVGASETGSTFDPDVPGILDVFLACIAKALSVQMKVKSSGPNKVCTTLTLSQCLKDSARSTRWWMRGKMDSGLAATIMELIKDMAMGKLSESWATNTKAAIAEAILNMTKLEEEHRDPPTCVKTPTLWLALASLCVLDQDHVDRLSSGEWMSGPDHQHGQPRPTCDNHDDSVTTAIILCSDCGNLCAECDRFLHLPRRMRGHQRQVFKEEEEAIKVDLHEGCGRIKLFWVMSLVDSKTFKAMVEFREGKVSNATVGPGTCRFCGQTSNTGLLAIGNVCSEAECQEFFRNACTQILQCGHLCGGIIGEDPCLPCLHRCRPSDQERLKQDADDMCMICFTEALAAAPAIQLSCSHVFHLHCTKMVLTKRYVGARITFGFSLCPICKTSIDHPALKLLLEPIRNLKADVKRKALMRLEYEGLDKAEAILTPGARFHEDPAGFAMDRYAYYVCFKCNKAYYGGEARCDDAVGGNDDFDPSELVCGACSDVSRAQMCAKHGADFLEYKCRYCCSVAVFFCFGTTHFCNPCHEEFQRVTAIPKKDLPHCPAGAKGVQLEGEECPLHVLHPPTGEEFALGCGVCRNAHTF